MLERMLVCRSASCLMRAAVCFADGGTVYGSMASGYGMPTVMIDNYYCWCCCR